MKNRRVWGPQSGRSIFSDDSIILSVSCFLLPLEASTREQRNDRELFVSFNANTDYNLFRENFHTQAPILANDDNCDYNNYILYVPLPTSEKREAGYVLTHTRSPSSEKLLNFIRIDDTREKVRMR